MLIKFFFFLVSVLIILLVLLQSGKGSYLPGTPSGSGFSGTFFGSVGIEPFIKRMTAWLTCLWFGLAIFSAGISLRPLSEKPMVVPDTADSLEKEIPSPPGFDAFSWAGLDSGESLEVDSDSEGPEDHGDEGVLALQLDGPDVDFRESPSSIDGQQNDQD